MVFRDREHAGRLLARELERFRAERPLVLGLTRGGVPVALEVARALRAELDVIVVRKIGAPGFPEYAIGAVAEGGAVYVRKEALRETGVGEEELARLAEREAAEVARRAGLYRGGRPLPDLSGRTAIVVDDGVATGATAHAAARAARRRGAARVVLAAPVVAAVSEPELRGDFDEVVAVQLPDPFMAVGLWYERFEQVSDEEVLACLERARPRPSRGEGGELWNGEWMRAAPPDPPGPTLEEEQVAIPLEGLPGAHAALEADLALPPGARGLVMFVHGSGSTRRSPRNRLVARALQRAGFATLLFDLLTPAEAAEDARTGELRFDIELLTGRVLAAIRWLSALPRTRALRLGLFGASTGAAAALAAAAGEPARVAAVISRGGRPDLVPAPILGRVAAPVLLVVGSRDEVVLGLNRSVVPHLRRCELAVVPGATHLFEEPGALEAVAGLAAGWLTRQLGEPEGLGQHPNR